VKALHKIYITKICHAFDANGREFAPLQDAIFDQDKNRWYVENYSVEDLIIKFKDCIVSAPGGELEYGNGAFKKYKDDWVIVVYNNFFEI
jgi:hypothetical protein